MKDLNSLALRSEKGRLQILDQQLLPQQEVWIEVRSPSHMVEIIKALKVRGAPLIGVAAVLSLASYAESGPTLDNFLCAADELRAARPTAVNLMVAIDRLKKVAAAEESLNIEAVVTTAQNIFSEDVQLCDRIADQGVEFLREGDGVLTHCNTGGLATAGIGTALGVIKRGHERGLNLHVYVDETRPLLQGGRLTTWELQKWGIPYTLICDNMAATLMRDGRIQKVLTGADRIARNGDFANKIGTYGVAVLAQHHKIPFCVAAPRTTVDLDCRSGLDIEIEQRSPLEVRGASGSFGTVEWAVEGCATYNPAFDMTPHDYVDFWALDTGLYSRRDVQEGALMRDLNGSETEVRDERS